MGDLEAGGNRKDKVVYQDRMPQLCVQKAKGGRGEGTERRGLKSQGQDRTGMEAIPPRGAGGGLGYWIEMR